MTSVEEEEETLYDVLEVEPRATLEEIRAAHARAAEAFGPESIAVYALVDEAQVDALREKLAEAAQVLLDPARRASYDRSIGLVAPGTLWDEDEEDEAERPTPEMAQEAVDAAPAEPVGPGPHPLEAEPVLHSEATHEAAPEQRALDLEIADSPGPFGRGAPEPSPDEVAAPEPAPALPEVAAASSEPSVEMEPPASEPAEVGPPLQHDWAAAVAEAPPPVEAEAGPPPDPEPSPAGRRRPPPLPRSSLGLRRPSAARPGGSSSTPAGADGAGRDREPRARPDIPPDVEFNGELLRQVREAHGLSLQQVAERTRITRIHLENVEADRYDNLPATVYLRGILVNLARELRLDPARVSKSYLLVAQRAQARGP